ncbi:hypothetical protein CR513_34825, partial [Mucuna pruriens]
MNYIRKLGKKLDKVGKGLDSVLRGTQSVNANVKVLSKGKEERPKMASMHESEESYEGDNLGESNGGRRSSRSSMVEMQFRRRSESRKTYGGSSGWKGKQKEKDRARKEKVLRRGVNPPLTKKNSHLLLHICLLKLVALSVSREVITSSASKILSDGSHYEGDLLVVRRLMNSHVSEETETQRENIFHSRCLILENLCSMIIDGGDFEKGELLVNRQAEVMFTLKGYEDRVVFDVVPMEATHLLLGRPWQFDKKVIHDRVINRFTFIHLGQRIVLKPLSPREVHEDQKKMNVKERVREKSKKKESKSDVEKRKVRGKEKVGEKKYDVLGVVIGVVLLQEGQSIAYFNEKLKSVKLNYSTNDREFYHIINLATIFIAQGGQGKLSRRHAKWVEFMEKFPYMIKHKQDKTDVVVNALSRRYALISMLETKMLGLDCIKELFCKIGHFIPCHKSNDASHVSNLFFKDVVQLLGLSRTIVLDRDTKFLEHFWRSLWSKLKTKLLFSTTCHPQTDGQTEVVNRTLGKLLRCFVKKSLRDWEDWIPHIEFAYNRVFNSTTSYLLCFIVLTMKGFPKPNLFKIYMIGHDCTWKRNEKNMQSMLEIDFPLRVHGLTNSGKD